MHYHCVNFDSPKFYPRHIYFTHKLESDKFFCPLYNRADHQLILNYLALPVIADNCFNYPIQSIGRYSGTFLISLYWLLQYWMQLPELEKLRNYFRCHTIHWNILCHHLELALSHVLITSKCRSMYKTFINEVSLHP